MDKKLYRYQQQAVEFALSLRARCLLALEMGLGKTRIAIETACSIRDCRRIIVVAPLSAAGIWRQEVVKWAPEARTVTCIDGSVARRSQRLRSLQKRNASRRIFVILGYESFWREPLRAEIIRYNPSMIIYDEAHRLKGRGTKQSRFAHSLASNGASPAHILALTGTPLPNGPEDAFSLFKSISPTVFGTRWIDFEDRYLIKGGFQRYQIVGYRNLPEFKQKIAANAFRITKAEALDLPDLVDVLVPFDLSTRARRIYDKLAKDAIAEIDGIQGSGTALGKIVITNELRLQQVNSGFVRVEEEGKIIDFDTSRQDVFSDLLRDALAAAGRVVVFCRFRHDVDAAIAVSKRLCGDSVYRIDGQVPQRDREAQLAWFKTFMPSVLVGQIQVASLAIDLSCAHIGIFYSRNWSFVNYDQSRGRLHRHGQKEKVTYYSLVARNTIDEKIAAALEHKQDLSATLLKDRERAREFFS